MGKRLIHQRRGKGSTRYRVPSHRYLGKTSYSVVPLAEKSEGNIIEITHSPGKLTPFAYVSFKQTDAQGASITKKVYTTASEGMFVGQKVSLKQLSQVQEGSRICNIELRPGDGGKICKSSGAFATLISKDEKRVVILLPSKNKKIISPRCRAIEGSIASAGRKEKPFMKAGIRHHAMRVRGKLYPRTSGVAMNAVDHPFGGQTRPGKPKSVSRHASPGRKVGNIAPRRTGRRRGKKARR